MEFKENENRLIDEGVQDMMRQRKRRGKILILVFIFLITNIFSFTIGNRWSTGVFGKIAASTSQYDELFAVRNLIKKYYYKDIDENTMVEGSIKGLASSLNDPYTVFMNEKEYKDFSTNTTGTYVGVGLQVGVRDDKITVIAPIDNSPAKKAGIITGDVLKKVDGKDMTGNDLEKAVSMMKGKEGETVTLTFSRSGVSDFDVKIKREPIVLNTVKSEMLQDNMGYIQLSMFDEKTDEDFLNAAKDLKAKGMKGIVLDLRGNPGGLLTTCVNISSAFVEKGKVIVSTKDKAGNEEKETSKGGSSLLGVPLVVLVDDGTASASEILSGVVRDYKLGTLIGVKTFGKGVVQVVLDSRTEPALKNGTALKVTISKYYTPNGENIDKVGIKPDIEVKYPEELKTKPYSRDTDVQFSKAVEVLKSKMK